MPKLCILCKKNKAEIPDREQMGRPIKRICEKCHAVRIMTDFIKIINPLAKPDMISQIFPPITTLEDPFKNENGN